jgi:tRNA-dihydrouridine synthase
VAFRRLCRQYGAGLYVCEMITTRALVERDAIVNKVTTSGVDPDRVNCLVEP